VRGRTAGGGRRRETVGQEVAVMSREAIAWRRLWIGAIGLGLVVAALVVVSSPTRTVLVDRGASRERSATPTALPVGTRDRTLVLEGMGFT